MSHSANKNIFISLFGANDWRGQLLFLIPGAVVGFIDVYVIETFPALPMIAIFGALIIFPPYRLPAKGLDETLERSWLRILTFGTSGFMGLFLGIACAWALCTFEGRQLGLSKVTSVASLSLVWSFTCAFLMAMAFFQVGFLSREYQQTFAFQFAKIPGKGQPGVVPASVGVLLYTATVGFKAAMPASRLLEELARGDVVAIFGFDPTDPKVHFEKTPILAELLQRIDLDSKSGSQRKLLEHRVFSAVRDLKKEMGVPEEMFPDGWPDHLTRLPATEGVARPTA